MLIAYIISIVLFFITAVIFVQMTTAKGGVITLAETVVGSILAFIPVINIVIIFFMGSDLVKEYGPRPMFGKKDNKDNVISVDFKKKNQQ